MQKLNFYKGEYETVLTIDKQYFLLFEEKFPDWNEQNKIRSLSREKSKTTVIWRVLKKIDIWG